MRPADHPRLIALLMVGAFAGGLLWAAEDLKAWLHPLFSRIVQTSGIPASVRCTLPTEHERLVIVVSWQDGALKHRCMFVGSRGTYSPPAKVDPS